MKTKRELQAHTKWQFLLIGITGLIIAGMITYSTHKSIRMNTIYAPLIDAVMEIRLEAAIAHLWLEEILSGDRHNDIEVVWKHLDQSDWYARAMLEGGKNPHGTFVNLNDTKLNHKILEVRTILDSFKNITEERIAHKEDSGIGTVIDQRYDEVFNTLIIQTENVEDTLKRIMNRDLRNFKYTQQILIFTCTFLSILVGIIFHRFNRKRTQNILAILDANVSLKKETNERKQAEENLHKLSHAVEQSPSTIVITDINAKIEYVNPRFTQLTGYTSEEAIGQNPRILKSNKTSSEEYKRLWDKITSGNVWHGEFCNKKKNGELYWESAHISPIKDREGVIINFVAVKEDITAHKEAQQALSDSEERFRTINNTANDSIIMVDNDGKVLFWNTAAKKMFYFSSEEAVGRSLHELVMPANLQERFLKGFGEFRSTGQGPFVGNTVELTAMRKDGTEFPIEHSISAVKLKGKWHAVGIIRDITERKQAEEKIKQSLDKMRTTMDGVVNTLALTIEYRDPYTAGHQQRVSNLACTIANEMELSKKQIEGIRMAGIVHDIGKMHIPIEILSRPGKLTESEFNIVKSHVHVGYKILKGIEFPWPVADIVHQHHENMDGSGYPLNLSNGDILLEARIICVADVVEAMASHRPYRPALGIDKALEEISKGKDVCYDSDAVDACLKVFQEKGFEFEQ